MLDSKKLSNKINYDVLANLFNTDAHHLECVRTVLAAAPILTVSVSAHSGTHVWRLALSVSHMTPTLHI